MVFLQNLPFSDVHILYLSNIDFSCISHIRNLCSYNMGSPQCLWGAHAVPSVQVAVHMKVLGHWILLVPQPSPAHTHTHRRTHTHTPKIAAAEGQRLPLQAANLLLLLGGQTGQTKTRYQCNQPLRAPLQRPQGGGGRAPLGPLGPPWDPLGPLGDP